MKKLLATFILLTPLSCLGAMENLFTDTVPAQTILLNKYHPGWVPIYEGSPTSQAFNHTNNIPAAAKELIKDGVDLVNNLNRLRNALAVEVQTSDDAAAGVGSVAASGRVLVAPAQLPWETLAAAPEAARLFVATTVELTRTKLNNDGEPTEYRQEYSLAQLFEILRDDETIGKQWDLRHPTDFLARAKERVYTRNGLKTVFQETVVSPLTEIANSATSQGTRAEKTLREIARRVTAEAFSEQGTKRKGNPKIIVHQDHARAEDAPIIDLITTLDGEIELVREAVNGKITSSKLSTRSERRAERKRSKNNIRPIVKKYMGTAHAQREDVLAKLVELRATLADTSVYRDPSTTTARNISLTDEAQDLLVVANGLWNGIYQNPTLVPFMTVLGIAPYVDCTNVGDLGPFVGYQDLFAHLNRKLELVGQPEFPVQAPAAQS